MKISCLQAKYLKRFIDLVAGASACRRYTFFILAQIVNFLVNEPAEILPILF